MPSSCLDSQALQAILDNTLSEEELGRHCTHLDTCVNCQLRLEDLARGTVVEGISEATAIQEPGEQLDRVIDGLLIQPQRTQVGRRTQKNPWIDILEQSPDVNCLGVFAGYQVHELLGRGGMGLVLRAVDPSLRRLVAIKVLSPEMASQRESRLRFQREAQAAAAVEHDHVVPIYAVDQWQGLPYLVMQYVEGESLQQRIDRQGPLPVDELLRIGQQIALGLAAAHDRGLVHRDVKPANILLEKRNDRVKITDFGLAKAADDMSLTRTGVVAGTPQYMAPEQAHGTSAIDHRVDLFALGTLLYAASTGRSPFTGHSTLEIIQQICEVTPPKLGAIRSDIPDAAVVLIEQLMAKSPQRRPQSAAAVASRLSQIQWDSPQSSESPGPRVRRRQIATISIAAVALLLLATLTFAVVSRAWKPLDDNVSTRVDGMSGDSEKDPHRATAALGDFEEMPFQIVGKSLYFTSLSEAVAAAKDGDVVEIYKVGPFDTSPIDAGSKAITIRGADSVMPKLRLVGSKEPLLKSSGKLALEGLELYWHGSIEESFPKRIDDLSRGFVVQVNGGLLRAANCRFMAETTGCIAVTSGHCQLVNCQLAAKSGTGMLYITRSAAPVPVTFRNCVFSGRVGISIIPFVPPDQDGISQLGLYQNTIAADVMLQFHIPRRRIRRLLVERGREIVRVQTNSNLFACDTLINLKRPAADMSAMPINSLNLFMQRLFDWRETKNYYRDDLVYVQSPYRSPPAAAGLAAWLKLWEQDESESVTGTVTFAKSSPEVASDFVAQLDPTVTGTPRGSNLPLVGWTKTRQLWQGLSPQERWNTGDED